MSNFSERVEAACDSWARLIVRRRWAAIFVSVACTALAAALLPSMRVDNSAESFLQENDPALEAYHAFQEQFGQDQQIAVVVQPKELFDLDTLARLRELHRDLEREVPHIDEVNSLVNARQTRGEGDSLIIEDLLEDWPENAAELAALRAKVLAEPLYRNTLVNPSGSLTVITVKPSLYSALGGSVDLEAVWDAPEAGASATSDDVEPTLLNDAEVAEQLTALQSVIARHRSADFALSVVGAAPVNQHLTAILLRDGFNSLNLAMVLTVALLYVLFRRVSGVVLPLLVVVASLVATFGVMAWMDIPFSITTAIVPRLILMVAIADAIHLLTLYYAHLDHGASVEDSLAYALRTSAIGTLLTCATTGAGLVSFASSEIAQIANLGLIAPLGVVVALVYSMVLLPALLSFVSVRRRTSRRVDAEGGQVGEWLAVAGRISARHSRAILIGSALLTGLSVLGALQLRFSQDRMAWLPDGDPVKEVTNLVDRELGGASSLEVLIRTEAPDGLKDPEVLRGLDRAMAFAESFDDGRIRVGKAVSIVQVVKESHRALNEGREEYYAIPAERTTVAQELTLFESRGGDDVAQLVDRDYQTARLVLKQPFVDAMYYPGFIQAIESGIHDAMGPGVQVESTGIAALFGRMFVLTNHTMASSYVTSLVLISLLMVFAIGSVRVGLLAMVPNVVPTVMLLGIMGWWGVALDNSTLLLGSVMLGIAVDDTIHFMHRFQRNLEELDDVIEAVDRTLRTTGAALLFTSLVLLVGFATGALAYMRNIVEFGLLASVGVILAFLAEIVIAPAVLVRFAAKRALPA